MEDILRHSRVECAHCGLVVSLPLFGGMPRGWVGYDRDGAALCGKCFAELCAEQQAHFNEPPINAKAQVLNALMQTGKHRGDETWQETKLRLMEREAGEPNP